MSNLWKISHLRKCQPAPVSPKQCQYWQQWKGRSKTWKVSWVRVNIIRIINNVITFWVQYRGFGQMHFSQGLCQITSQCYPLKLAVFPAGISDICMTTAFRNLLCWNLYSIFSCQLSNAKPVVTIHIILKINLDISWWCSRSRKKRGSSCFLFFSCLQ